MEERFHEWEQQQMQQIQQIQQEEIQRQMQPRSESVEENKRETITEAEIFFEGNTMEKMREIGPVFQDFHLPRYDELPGISLYLDQVIGILNDTLEPLFDYDEDKIISGAMVNNYVKNKVISAPVKKRYSRRQLCGLLVLSVMKKVFSISEIGMIIKLHDSEEEARVGYNRFCDELELALKMKFGQVEAVNQLQMQVNWDEKDMMRSAALSVANKIYVQKLVFMQLEGERKSKVGEGGKKKKEK